MTDNFSPNLGFTTLRKDKTPFEYYRDKATSKVRDLTAPFFYEKDPSVMDDKPLRLKKGEKPEGMPDMSGFLLDSMGGPIAKIPAIGGMFFAAKGMARTPVANKIRAKKRAARRMEQEGYNPEYISKKTGWNRQFPDKQWRYESHDKNFKYRTNWEAKTFDDQFGRWETRKRPPTAGEKERGYRSDIEQESWMIHPHLKNEKMWGKQFKEKGYVGSGNDLADVIYGVPIRQATLGNVIDPKWSLFKTHPELKNMKINVYSEKNMEGMGGFYGYPRTAGWGSKPTHASRRDAFIGVREGGPEDMLETIMHEVQHHLQEIGGLAKGSSPKSWQTGEKKMFADYLIKKEKAIDERLLASGENIIGGKKRSKAEIDAVVFRDLNSQMNLNKKYRISHGEKEANLPWLRKWMSEQQQRQKHPFSTVDKVKWGFSPAGKTEQGHPYDIGFMYDHMPSARNTIVHGVGEPFEHIGMKKHYREKNPTLSLPPGSALGKLEKLYAGPRSGMQTKKGGRRVGEISGEKFFHGTRTEAGEGGDFGGIHLGTRKAAHDRLRQTYWLRSISKKGRIDEATVNLKKTLGTKENPVDEDELFNIVNLSSKLKNLKARGIDGIIYRNDIEDPGSISVLALNKSSISNYIKGKSRDEKKTLRDTYLKLYQGMED